jgi:OOP family OmpA-OmpF porin
VVFEPRVAGQLRLGMVRIGLNVGVRLRQHERQFENLTIGHEFTAALAVAIVPTKLLDVVIELHADSALSSQFGSAAVSPVEALLGLGLHAGPVRFGAALGAGLVDGYGSPRFRFLLSVTYQKRSKDNETPAPLTIAKAPKPKAPAAVKPAPAPVAITAVAAADPPGMQELVAQLQGVGAPQPNDLPRVRAAIGQPVLFELNSFRLTERFKEHLAGLVGELKSGDAPRLVWVEGHADEIGTPAWNQELSRLRAEAVVGFLIERGIDGNRLQPVGFGDSQPIDHRGGRNVRNRCVLLFSDGEASSGASAVSTLTKGIVR